MHAVAPTIEPDAGIASLRTPLLADLIRRGASLSGLTVHLVQDVLVGAPPADLPALNIYPAEHYRRPDDPRDLVERVSVVILGSWADEPLRRTDADAPHTVRVGPLLFEGRATRTPGGVVPSIVDLSTRSLDPLALRLHLLSHDYRGPVDVDWGSLRAAYTTLVRWRRNVATWATEPSAAMPPGTVAALRAAIDDDLDLPAVVRALLEMEGSSDVPAGAKFETFAYIDRVLGLDLVREVGR